MENSGNSNEGSNPVNDNLPPPESINWPLHDLDIDRWEDEIFRAGAPFPDIPEMELNGSCEWYDASSTFDNNLIESDNSDAYISTPKSNKQIAGLSTEQQKKKVNNERELEDNLMKEDCENVEIIPNEKDNYVDEQHGDDHQDVDKAKNKETNIQNFES